MPPEELFIRTLSSLLIAAKMLSGLRSSRGCRILHTFSHNLQLMHIDESTCGYRNPSLSEVIDIHDFGHACAQALHPQQSSFLVITIMPIVEVF